jgi:hypothetical protein
MTKLLLQKELDAIIKEIITPMFKNEGYRKSDRNYYKDFTHHGLCFNIQSSLYNNAQEIRFTFNTGIFVPEIYKIYFNSPIPKFPKEYDCFNRKRIGDLMGTTDYWYSITDQTNIDCLKVCISTHIKTYAIPYLREYKNVEDILKLYRENRFSKAPYDYASLAGLMILFGMKKEGAKLIKNHYHKSSNEGYKGTLKAYAAKLGVELT